MVAARHDTGRFARNLLAANGNSGVSRRVLGTFLTWLAEQRSRIFIVATANDIASLPPELIRKGRSDEIFFVDLPGLDARAEIIAIHARKRGLRLNPAELAALASRCSGRAPRLNRPSSPRSTPRIRPSNSSAEQ